MLVHYQVVSCISFSNAQFDVNEGENFRMNDKKLYENSSLNISRPISNYLFDEMT